MGGWPDRGQQPWCRPGSERTSSTTHRKFGIVFNILRHCMQCSEDPTPQPALPDRQPETSGPMTNLPAVCSNIPYERYPGLGCPARSFSATPRRLLGLSSGPAATNGLSGASLARATIQHTVDLTNDAALAVGCSRGPRPARSCCKQHRPVEQGPTPRGGAHPSVVRGIVAPVVSRGAAPRRTAGARHGSEGRTNAEVRVGWRGRPAAGRQPLDRRASAGARRRPCCEAVDAAGARQVGFEPPRCRSRGGRRRGWGALLQRSQVAARERRRSGHQHSASAATRKSRLWSCQGMRCGVMASTARSSPSLAATRRLALPSSSGQARLERRERVVLSRRHAPRMRGRRRVSVTVPVWQMPSTPYQMLQVWAG